MRSLETSVAVTGCNVSSNGPVWCADDWATRRLGERPLGDRRLGDRLLGDKAGRLGDTATAVAYSGCKQY